MMNLIFLAPSTASPAASVQPDVVVGWSDVAGLRCAFVAVFSMVLVTGFAFGAVAGCRLRSGLVLKAVAAAGHTRWIAVWWTVTQVLTITESAESTLWL